MISVGLLRELAYRAEDHSCDGYYFSDNMDAVMAAAQGLTEAADYIEKLEAALELYRKDATGPTT